jgi:hypothetical protein
VIWRILLILAVLATPAAAQRICSACHFSSTPSRADLIRPPDPPPLVLDLPPTASSGLGGADDPPPVNNPEPATLWLLGAALTALGWRLRR